MASNDGMDPGWIDKHDDSTDKLCEWDSGKIEEGESKSQKYSSFHKWKPLMKMAIR